MDDAYIFRSYAVNLASGLGWGFNPGEVSFGVTSFIWPLITALPLVVFPSLKFEQVALAIGVISYCCLIPLIELWSWRETKSLIAGFAAGSLLAISPMGYMNAVSGMETMTFALGMVGALALYRFYGLKRPLLMGLLAGLMFLVRPEGLYLAIAIPGAELVSDLIERQARNVRKYAWFLMGFAILTVPYVALIRFHTPGWLPTTYVGKIISTTPMARHSFIFDVLAALRILYKGHWRCLSSFGFPGAVLWASATGWTAWMVAGIFIRKVPAITGKAKIRWLLLLAATIGTAYFSSQPQKNIIEGIFFLLAIMFLVAFFLALVLPGKEGEIKSDKLSVSLLPVIGLMLFPLAYGVAFRAGPLFGGFYNRYILVLLPALALISICGVMKIIEPIEKPLLKKAAALGLAHLLGYSFFIAAGDMNYHREAYQWEARLSSGIRMEAAQWMNRNTPEESVVLVGYTGLGVVGGFTDRYVLDMGALINPDIFPYYRGVPAIGVKHWERTVKYIIDRKVDYFVTVPGLKKDPSSDPTGTPGFEKVARMEDPELKGAFSAIEIWRIDRELIADR